MALVLAECENCGEEFELEEEEFDSEDEIFCDDCIEDGFGEDREVAMEDGE
jgi:formylmethanofuran dehydrogenase subunit E